MARVSATDMTLLVEAYLLIDQPRQRLGHWTAALAALDSPAAPPLAAVVVLYDPTTDQALINLRYDELALGEEHLAFVVEVALLAEIGMIQPAELSDGERRRFLTERLARCTMQVQASRNTVGGLVELVRRLRDQRNVAKPKFEAPPRGDTEDPVLLVTAKGTRDDLRQLSSTAWIMPEKFPRPTSPHRHVVSRSSRADTVVGAPIDAYANEFDEPPQTAPAPYGELARDRAGGAEVVQPEQTATDSDDKTIHARYLRSGKWLPLRIGALSLKGAALMTGALPRLHDQVEVALTFCGHRALVRGAVGKVSSMSEAAATGASTFSVAFDLDTAARRELTELLTSAREQRVTIKPPPARATRRLVVEWPVCLGTTRGAIKADALDISTTGMFVRPAVALALGTVLNFSAAVDDGGGPVAGRAKVVRQLTAVDAAAVGLAPGFGLSIVEMSGADEARWQAFIARIERRAALRVLIGASPQRLGELQDALAAAGYAVMGGTDPGALVQLASSDARPVDAVLIDASWLDTGTAAAWIESLFSARCVPCITAVGDPRRARGQVDQLLAVAGPKNHTGARS